MGDRPGARTQQRMRKKLRETSVSGAGGSRIGSIGNGGSPTQVSVYDYPEAGPDPKTDIPRDTDDWRSQISEANRRVHEATVARKQAERAYSDSRRELARHYKQLDRDDRDEMKRAFGESKALMDSQRAEVRRLAAEAKQRRRDLQDDLQMIQQRLSEASRLIGSIGSKGDTRYLRAEIAMLTGMLSAQMPLLGEVRSEESAHRRELKQIQGDLKTLAGTKKLDDKDRRAYESEMRELEQLEREDEAQDREFRRRDAEWVKSWKESLRRETTEKAPKK